MKEQFTKVEYIKLTVTHFVMRDELGTHITFMSTIPLNIHDILCIKLNNLDHFFRVVRLSVGVGVSDKFIVNGSSMYNNPTDKPDIRLFMNAMVYLYKETEPDQKL
jgi:hypothetical protein